MLFTVRTAQRPVRSGRLVSLSLGVVVLGLALAVGGGLVTAAGAVIKIAEPYVDGAPVVVDADRHVVLEEYGAEGSQVIGYSHGQRVRVRFVLRNPGVLPLHIERIDAFPVALGMLAMEEVSVDGAALPVRLGPFDQAVVEVVGRFGNCEYFTERAIDTYDHALVTWRVGTGERVAPIAYGDQLLVRSPAIVACPDRVLDRSAKQRSQDATITGRG